MRLLAFLLTLTLTGCASFTPPPRLDPLRGLVPEGFKAEKSDITLAQVGRGQGVVAVASAGTQQSIEYVRKRVANEGKYDLIGNIAKEQAGADPTRSVVAIAELLKSCFGSVRVVNDFREAVQAKPDAIVLIDVAYDYPFMDLAGNTAFFDLHFFDARLREIDKVSVEGRAMPSLGNPVMTFSEPQRRAAAALQKELSSRVGRSC